MNIETWQFIIAILVFVGGLLGVAMRVGYVVASAIAKINEQMATQKAEFNALLELKEAESGKAIGRVYQRFDEYKTNLESNFVRREMCQVLHNGNSITLANMEKKMDIQGEKLDDLILKVAGLK